MSAALDTVCVQLGTDGGSRGDLWRWVFLAGLSCVLMGAFFSQFGLGFGAYPPVGDRHHPDRR